MIERYFQLATESDPSAYFDQFTADAVVEDEGHEYRGLDAIRRWRTEVPPVHYDVRSIADVGDGTLAAVQIAGDFPGSPVELKFYFESAGDKIAALRIRV